MAINRKQMALIKIYAFLLVFIFVTINWNGVSWLFNYKEVSGLFYDFFNPYPNSPYLVSAESNVNSASAAIIVSEDKNLEIPNIGVQTPVVIGSSLNPTALEESLNEGAVLYPGSVQPGQKGQIILLGHSAPVGWPKVRHDWIFSDIEKLNPGDKIIFNFNGKQYTYIMADKNIIQPGQEINVDKSFSDKNVLILVSCWPPGKNYKRIAVISYLEAK